MTGIRSTFRSYALLPWRHVRDSLILREVRRKRPDRRADRHLVVVDDDQHLRLALADVVERLEREPAHQRRVTDDDGDPLETVAQVAGFGEALRDRQPGPRVTAIEDVVGRLGPSREAADAIELSQRPEAVEPPGQELVRVGLVSRVPDDPIARRFEQAVQGDGQLDDAERRSEVSAGARHGADDGVADLDGQLGELDLVETAQVGGALDGRQDRHGWRTPGSGGVGCDRGDGPIALHVMIDARWMTAGMVVRLECKPVPSKSLVSAGRRDRTTARGLMMEQFVVDRLRDSLRKRVTTPDDPGYDAARTTFNATVHRRPAVIVRVRDDADVVAAVVAANDLGLPIAVRGGGHSVAGHAMADDALVVDLRDRREVTVDPKTRIVRVAGGALWEDVDTAAWRHHLAVVGGTVIDTGVAGLTLGGGIGWLSGLAGFTCDNLVRAELVTAAGERVVAGPDGDPDLLWALRGGGGNFGVVTSFEFRAIDPGPILAGYIYYPISAVKQVLRQLAAVAETAPDALELTAQIGPHDEALADGLSVRVGVCWPGDLADRDGDRAPVAGGSAGDRGHGRPDGVSGRPGDERAAGVRAPPLLEGALPADARRVDHHGDRRLDGGATTRQQHDPARGDPRCSARVEPEGGAAFGQRAATWNASALGIWDDPLLDDSHIAWARGVGRSTRGRVADRRRVRQLRPGR